MAAIISGDLLQPGALARLRGGKLEAIKWCAFALMIVDHYAAYVAVVDAPFADFLGAMVFPMFAFAFAVGLSSHSFGRRADVIGGLVGWGIVAQLAALLVRDGLPLNVLFTFAAALMLDQARDDGELVWHRVLFVVCGVGLGYMSEFSWPGVALMLSLLWWTRSGSVASVAVAGVSLVALEPSNASWGAVCAPLVVALLVWSDVSLPRVRAVFYPAYAGQFVLMAGLAWLLR